MTKTLWALCVKGGAVCFDLDFSKGVRLNVFTTKKDAENALREINGEKDQHYRGSWEVVKFIREN